MILYCIERSFNMKYAIMYVTSVWMKLELNIFLLKKLRVNYSLKLYWKMIQYYQKSIITLELKKTSIQIYSLRCSSLIEVLIQESFSYTKRWIWTLLNEASIYVRKLDVALMHWKFPINWKKNCYNANMFWWRLGLLPFQFKRDVIWWNILQR